jgi:hypothetical protein
MRKWPKDNQAALIRFYGKPPSVVEKQMVYIEPPFRMTYSGAPLTRLRFHKKAAPALAAALQKIWDFYGHDQAMIDKLGVSRTAGTFNPRKIRGSKTKWSNHAYGAAIDINSEENGLGAVRSTIPLPVIAAFKSEGAKWGGDYKGRKDNMHFEFVDSGEPERTFDKWLEVLGVTKEISQATVALPARHAEYDEDVSRVQTVLKRMNYNPGGLDGRWGGMTAGAISAFLNDRESDLSSPTSLDEFGKVLTDLDAEIEAARGAGFVRPVSQARASMTAAGLSETATDVSASRRAEKVSFWGAVGTATTATITGIGQFFSDAVEWLSPVKQFVTDLPWPVWASAALVLSSALYYISRQSGNSQRAAVKDYQEGLRQ